MRWLLGVYTKRFNIWYKLCGHLFAGRYKALLVDGSGDGYLRTVCDYVHLNRCGPGWCVRQPRSPALAGAGSLGLSGSRPNSVPNGSGRTGCWGEGDSARIVRRAVADSAGKCRTAAAGGAESDYQSIRQGWCLGSEEFRQELLAAVVERVGCQPLQEPRATGNRGTKGRTDRGGRTQAFTLVGSGLATAVQRG